MRYTFTRHEDEDPNIRVNPHDTQYVYSVKVYCTLQPVLGGMFRGVPTLI